MKISKARGLNEDEGEDVALVTMASELKTGIVVWLTPCKRCAGHHRFILGNPLSGESISDGVTRHGLKAEPRPSCMLVPAGYQAVIRWSTDGPELYRVVDPLLDQHFKVKHAEKVTR
jgi:hypothetical protein